MQFYITLYVQKFQVFLRYFRFPDIEASANKKRYKSSENNKPKSGFGGFL